MSFFRKKKYSPPYSAPTNRLDSQSQASQQPSQSPQQTQLYPWSAHTPQSGQSPSPFPRHLHALSTTATAAGELFLFGGIAHDRDGGHIGNDLYVISTRDFSTTLLQANGDVPGPRCAHHAVLTGTLLLIWGGSTDSTEQNDDDSFYLLNLVSREWTRIVINGPGPGRRYYHTMTLVGSKLFVFGGRTGKVSRCLNDIWALDLNRLQPNPHWESYESAPGSEKPRPRSSHVSVATGDRIITFGGALTVGTPHNYVNETWSFNISTRKWTELKCTGSIPSPRAAHAAVLIDDVMYVFGGLADDETRLGDLTALNLSTQRWTAFQDIGPSPNGRWGHTMACDGTRVFVLGGNLLQVDKAKLIHVLDTKLLIYPKSDSKTVKHTEKTTQLAQEPSGSYPTQGQPQQPTFSSSDSDVHTEHGTSPVQKARPGELDHPASLRITHEQTPGPNDLPSLLPGMDDKPRRVPEEDNNSEGSTEPHTKFVAPYEYSEKEVGRLEHERIADLERQLSKTLAGQTERDRRIAQLTDQLAQMSALLNRAEANAAVAAAEAKENAELELRELQAKHDKSLLSRDRALEQAQSALHKATFGAAESNEPGQPICEHETVLAELLAKLEAKETELATVNSRLTDAEDGWAKSKAEADILRAQTAAGLVNMDVDRVMRRLMERVRSVETEMSALRGNEKSIESMECRNEG